MITIVKLASSIARGDGIHLVSKAALIMRLSALASLFLIQQSRKDSWTELI